MEIKSQTKIRPYNPKTDESFVYSSWLKSYRNNKYFAHAMDNETYFQFHALIIDTLVKDNNLSILCSKDDEDQIYGFICNRPDNKVIHFIYIKYPYRKMGLGKMLLNDTVGSLSDTTYVSHYNHHLDKYDNIKYNAYLLFNLKK